MPQVTGCASTDNRGVPALLLHDPVTGEAVPATTDMFATVMPTDVMPPSIPEIREKFNNFAGVDTANGDFATIVSGLNGQTYVVLSADPTNPGESRIEIDTEVKQPARFESAFSYVRGTQIFATASIYANDPVTGNPDPVPDPINIVSIYQSSADLGAVYNATPGSILTMLLALPLPKAGLNNAVYAGDWINITGFIDTRLNYQNLCIKYISSDRKTITCGYSDEGILPSLAIATITPPVDTAKVNFYNNMGGARDGLGMRMTASTATSNAIVSIRGGGDNQITIGGSNTATQGAAGSLGTDGSGAWLVRGGVHTITDVASAALTTIGTTTGSAISTMGVTGAHVINVDVTAITAGSRLITRVQGSLDVAGATFYNLYDIGVITTLNKNMDSPVIPVEFQRYRYVRDLRGASASCTHSINRTTRSLENGTTARRQIDRVISLTTTGPSTDTPLYSARCQNAVIRCTPLSGQTTAAVVKIQGCNGDPSVANNWFDLPGAPTLTTSATASVSTAVFSTCGFKSLRLNTTTAGVGMVADTYELTVDAW